MRSSLDTPADGGRVLDVEAKPRWRGWIHLATTPVAVVLGIVLIVVAHGAAAKAGSAIFMATALLLFGVSAIYHLLPAPYAAKPRLRRFDHANIFLLIAGTYTPLSLTALVAPESTILLVVVWGGALLGIAFRVFWLSAPRWLYVPIYLALGWAAVLYAGDLIAFDAIAMLLVLAGGVAYSLGAVFYALKRPNPVPGVFGFHELFHACTSVAFLAQWVGILLVVQHPVG
ncbi:hemolysin III family protein [Pseudolysinimonas kribbensis]|uniref:DNA-binding protein n=1 Tax=Pseudolysinimonas kribbensis TaxID=433641 RepID=A0ABQ6K9F7_9MICO|nr:hemolysin III family protein [Pseudolysinimonas kribbensis]GMA96230.1 DNA-binding protein [Pseudolysinimonas kribbensis]